MQRLTVKYIWIAIIVAGPSPTSASALEPVLVREIRPVEGGTSGFAESVDVSGDTVVVGVD